MSSRGLPPLERAQFIALDTETTGLHPAAGRLVEVAALRFDRTGRILAEFAELVNPGQPIPPEATVIHGITDEMVAEADGPDRVLPRLIAFIDIPDAVLVAHNAPFDLAFIAIAMARLGLSPPNVPVLDTRLLARHLLPHASGYALEQVAAYFGISIPDHHRALPDARAVRLVLLELLDYITPDQFPRLGDTLPVLSFADADIAPVEPPPGFEELAKALEEGMDLVIVYSGGSRRDSPRRVTPLALYRHGSRVYLAAVCHVDNVEKSFRLDRIRDIRLAGGD